MEGPSASGKLQGRASQARLTSRRFDVDVSDERHASNKVSPRIQDRRDDVLVYAAGFHSSASEAFCNCSWVCPWSGKHVQSMPIRLGASQHCRSGHRDLGLLLLVSRLSSVL